MFGKTPRPGPSGLDSKDLLRREQGEVQVFGGCGAAARSFLECRVAAVERVRRLAAVQNLLDGEDLQLRVGGAVGRFVEPGFGSFFDHGFGWRLEAEEDADL